ncbi:MAG TPA: C40 family peptidase [Chitinophagaceae bacterium]
MRYSLLTLFIFTLFISSGFRSVRNSSTGLQDAVATVKIVLPTIQIKEDKKTISTEVALTPVSNIQFTDFAKTLIGVPYVYGSMNPAVGFDCSGFVNYVGNHFGLKFPRSSVDFTNFGTEIERGQAKEGDLILFTGTDPAKKVVGHIGIVIENNKGQLQFIHSSSGKANGVTISDFSEHYQARFVKVIRIMDISSEKIIV